MDREIPKEVRNKERNKKNHPLFINRSSRYYSCRRTYINHADRSGKEGSGTFYD